MPLKRSGVRGGTFAIQREDDRYEERPARHFHSRLVDALVRRLATFDRETLGAAKAQINRFGMPTPGELQSSIDLFFPALASPSGQARRAKLRSLAYGVPSDFEMNFGRYLPTPGQAGDDGTEPPSPAR
ncbi:MULTISPECIES: hypothetical protein [Paraburkholderia]|uniref:hypothetical protein n=1 Tax=Paraburkholderia TaxID=1822464 RepID=UPI000364671B|nr:MULTISPECIES: hypothetical protein [Paraburkholderia]MDH6151797.1 hypothetical protein [Paraburkholderia sp. WSM4179]